MNKQQVMAKYSKSKARGLLRSKIKLIDRAEIKRNSYKKHEMLLITTKIIRSVYLYFNRRLILSHRKHIELLDKKVTSMILEMCIYNIKQIKKYKIKYSSSLNLQQMRYMNLGLNTLKKYMYLHHYKNVIIALILRTKFNGQEGVCRLIQSYI